MLRKARLLARIAAIFLLLAHSGCQSIFTPPKSGIPQNLAAETPGALAPGDVILLSFPSASELNQTQKIRADGKVNFPLVGEIQVAGKRIGALQTELARLYKSHLTNNEVVVSVSSSAIPVYVTGAVSHPGKVVLERPMTALEAIMEAGGTTQLGDLKKVIVIRNGEGKHFSQTLDLRPAVSGKEMPAFYLKAYDMIVVPERFF